MVGRLTHFSFGHAGQCISPVTIWLVFFRLIENIESLAKHKGKRLGLFFKRNNAHLTHGFASPWGHWLLLLSRDLGVFLCTQIRSEHIVFGQYTFPASLIMLLSYKESVINLLHIVFALNYFTLFCNITSILLELVNLLMVNFDNFDKNKLIAMYFKILMKKRKKCCSKIGTINEFVYLDVQRYCILMSKEIVFEFVDPISIWCFVSGFCKNLLALSKVLRKPRKLSTNNWVHFWRHSISLEDEKLLCFYVAKFERLEGNTFCWSLC